MAEQVLMEGIANPVAGLVIKNGHGVLTTKRFIYSKHSLAKIAVLGAFVNLTKGTYEYEIPLNEITTASAERFRLGHALIITKKDGTVLKYGIAKPKEWQAAFDKALSDTAEQDINSAGVEDVSTTKNFCQHCGVKLEVSARFCSNCGAKL